MTTVDLGEHAHLINLLPEHERFLAARLFMLTGNLYAKWTPDGGYELINHLQNDVIHRPDGTVIFSSRIYR